MSDTTSDEQLRLHVEAIENLEQEKKAIADDITDRYALVKCDGFDVSAVRAVVKRRKKQRQDIEEYDAILATYEAALQGDQ